MSRTGSRSSAAVTKMTRQPARRQAVEPLPVAGHLLAFAVPEALVLQRQLVLGPGEINAADPPAVDRDGVLRDRPGQVGPVDQQSQPGLLR